MKYHRERGSHAISWHSLLQRQLHLEARLLPGKATNSGRCDIFFSAVLTRSSRRRAQGGLRDAWVWSHGNTGHDSDDYVGTPLEGHHFDSGAVVVIDAQVAIVEGCEFFISGTSAILCKQSIPKVVILKIR